jgi:hypothetical protein
LRRLVSDTSFSTNKLSPSRHQAGQVAVPFCAIGPSPGKGMKVLKG